MEHGGFLSSRGLRSEPTQPPHLPSENGRSYIPSAPHLPSENGRSYIPSAPHLGGENESTWQPTAPVAVQSPCVRPRLHSEATAYPPFPEAAFPPSTCVPTFQQRVSRLSADSSCFPPHGGMASSSAPVDGSGFSGDLHSHSFGAHPLQGPASRMQPWRRQHGPEAPAFLAERTRVWGSVAETPARAEGTKRQEVTTFASMEETGLCSAPQEDMRPPSAPFQPRDPGIKGGALCPEEQEQPYRETSPPPVSFGSLSALRQYARDQEASGCLGAPRSLPEASRGAAEGTNEARGPASGPQENLEKGRANAVGPRVSPSISGSRKYDSVSQVYIPEKLQCEPQVVETVITVPRVMYEQKITEVPQVMVRERVLEVPNIVRKEKVVTIPKIEYQEKIVEVPVVKYVDKVVEVPQCVVAEKFVTTDEVIRQEKIVPIPKIEIVEKIIQTPKVIQVEKIVDVPRIEYREVEVEKIVEVPQIEIKYVEREVPVPQKVIRHVPVDKIVEVRQKKVVEKIVKIPVPRYVEVPRYIEQPVPREKIVRVEKKIERKVPTPQPQDTYQEVEKPVYVTKYIERRVPVPTERIVEEHVQVEVPREVIVKKPYDVVRLVQKQVEVAVPFVSGDPLILTAEGYIPFQEFAQKSQVLTAKDRQFYERQSEALGSVHASNVDTQPSSPSPSLSLTSTPEADGFRGAQARLPEANAAKGTSSVGGLSQTTQQSAAPLSPRNSPTSYSTCSVKPNLSQAVN
ncbi:alveolin domain containing intermediate filament IMC9 [Toxoplasma gondii VAND]|uniref:Alveolin domain containing intermediate filament IMC9 n=1 Tax=Toxoplasma gondii VAND TaxID=933077 RepID=A0A086QKM0_TOXGO|nr:alveolin domain containing intermediate filament IMC9 [Toxoplasma gondii VAND]